MQNIAAILLINYRDFYVPPDELIRCYGSEPLHQMNLPYRPEAPANKPGSLPHAVSIYALLKVLEFTLEALKEQTEKMVGRICRFTANSEAA